MTRKLAYQGRSIAVYLEDVVLPNGHRMEFDVVRHPGASAIVPFVNDREILMLRQFRHAAGGTILEVPAGKLDGDTPEVCAGRELEEEAGRRAGRLVPLGSIFTTPGFTDEVIFLFAAFDLEPVPPRPEPAEVIEVITLPLDEALELVWSGQLRDAKTAIALVHAARLMGTLP